jgi:hypothetical protein
MTLMEMWLEKRELSANVPNTQAIHRRTGTAMGNEILGRDKNIE